MPCGNKIFAYVNIYQKYLLLKININFILSNIVAHNIKKKGKDSGLLSAGTPTTA